MNPNASTTLNRLLRGELAATETYQQALSQLETSPEVRSLRRIHDDHRTAANNLRLQIRQHGGKPDKSSGAWGTFAKAVEGTATVLGKDATLMALKRGEEQGLADYQDALKEDTDLPADSRQFIANELLPQTRAHVSELDQLRGGPGAV